MLICAGKWGDSVAKEGFRKGCAEIHHNGIEGGFSYDES